MNPLERPQTQTTFRLPALPGRQSLAAAVLRTLAYADIFDYPLTVEEIHRYLIGLPVSLAEIKAYLGAGRFDPHISHGARGFYSLVGRENLVDRRRQRTRAAADLWQQARAWGRLIARLPFVRMLAVTGALAVNNAARDDDIDYLVVTAPGRLWLCRALVIAVVRAASLRGIRLCPNYFLSTRALAVEQRSLYSAHELVQMVPLYGLQVYHEMRQRNPWTQDHLPNAAGPPPLTSLPGASQSAERTQRLGEKLLQTRAGARLESWEMERKIKKLTAQAGRSSEYAFCADWCKGHFDNHGQATLSAYRTRVQALSLSAEFLILE